MEEIKSLQVTVTGLRAGKGILREFMEQYKASVLKIIDEAPTAYDVDKVVEKLQEYQSAFPVDSQNDYFRGVGIGAKSCIEIVKAGGVK